MWIGEVCPVLRLPVPVRGLREEQVDLDKYLILSQLLVQVVATAVGVGALCVD